MKKLTALLLSAVLLLGAVPALAENENVSEDTATVETDITETEAPAPETVEVSGEADEASEQIAEASEEDAEARTEMDAAEDYTAAEEDVSEDAAADTEQAAEEYIPPIKTLNITYDGIRIDFSSAPYIDDNRAMVPIKQLAEYIGFDVSYDANYNTEVLALGKNYIFFNIGTKYTTAFGEDLYALADTVMWGDTVYVSLRTFADIIGCELDVTDYGDSMTINMHNSTYVNEYFVNQPVNPWGISSRTDYMVWVSLSQYTVRLYHGKQYMWKLIHECPCAIGAPGTPTVTGSFEYQYRTQWNYNGYYVGPCLVFYRGYALHSVLLRYNNTEYDGRTGVKISHGCVRMKKADIDLIASKIPVGTRIYITP